MAKADQVCQLELDLMSEDIALFNTTVQQNLSTAIGTDTQTDFTSFGYIFSLNGSIGLNISEGALDSILEV